MESKTKNRKSRTQLEAMVQRAFGGMGLAQNGVTELTKGWFNAAYDLTLADGRHTILKIAPPSHAEVMTYERDLMRTEVAVMRLVKSDPFIPAPTILFFDRDRDLCDSDYFFMDKLPGTDLEHAKQSLSPESSAALEAETGRVVRRLHQFRGSFFGYDGHPGLRAPTWRKAFVLIVESVLHDAQSKWVDLGYALSELRTLINRHAALLDEVTVPSLVHWDAWDTNFFVHENAIAGLIDFERALWADPLMEAQFRGFFARPTPAQIAYGKATLTSHEQVRCLLYDIHLALVMLTECAYRDYDTDDVAKIAKGLLDAAVGQLRA